MKTEEIKYLLGIRMREVIDLLPEGEKTNPDIVEQILKEDTEYQELLKKLKNLE